MELTGGQNEGKEWLGRMVALKHWSDSLEKQKEKILNLTGRDMNWTGD